MGVPNFAVHGKEGKIRVRLGFIEYEDGLSIITFHQLRPSY